MVGDILQPTHLLFVLVIALLVLGPKRLPEVGQKLGSGLRDFRSAINGESSQNRHERDEPETIHAPSEPDYPAYEPAPHDAVVAEEEHAPAVAVEAAPSADDAPPPLSVAPRSTTAPETETRA